MKVFDFVLFDSWVLLEKDCKNTCTCSYCEEAKSITKKVTFWSPRNKASNSWRVFVFDSGDHWTYLRFTLPTWRCIVDITKWDGGWRFQLLNLFGKNTLRCLLGVSKMEKYMKAKIESVCWMRLK